MPHVASEARSHTVKPQLPRTVRAASPAERGPSQPFASLIDDGTQAANEAARPAQSADQTAATPCTACAAESSDSWAAAKAPDDPAAAKPSDSKAARGDEKGAGKDATTADSGKSEQAPTSDKGSDDAKNVAMGGEKAAVDGKVADVQQPLAAVAGTTGAAPAGPVTAGANSALAVATNTTTAGRHRHRRSRGPRGRRKGTRTSGGATVVLRSRR